jgi:hypothetical protein
MAGDYIAFIGGAGTYGKFVKNPFPELIEKRLGIECVNLGYMNAGVNVFLHDHTVHQTCNKARVTVIELVGAHNLNNRFYRVHSRRNDRFIAATPLLQAIFPNVEFADIHFTKHLLAMLKSGSQTRFEIICDELRDNWVVQMTALLEKIRGEKILLWFAGHPPDQTTTISKSGWEPLFVNREMIDAIRPFAGTLVEVIPPERDLPDSVKGMVFSDLEALSALQMPGIPAHRLASESLCGPIEKIIEKGPA